MIHQIAKSMSNQQKNYALGQFIVGCFIGDIAFIIYSFTNCIIYQSLLHILALSAGIFGFIVLHRTFGRVIIKLREVTTDDPSDI